MRAREFVFTEEDASIDPEKKKSMVLRALNKARADDPIFNQAYKLIVGPALATRIENLIGAHKDPDIKAEEMAYLIKTIPTLGTAEEIKDFVAKWNEGKDFIDIGKLIPAGGMEQEESLEAVVQDGIPKLLFQSLTRAGMFSKGDAGPAEAALAIMSNDITFPIGKGGDVVIGDARIEVKGGGKAGRGQGGGRIWGKEQINQQPITDFLEKEEIDMTGKSMSVRQASDPEMWEEDFPLKEFAKIVSRVWFKRIVPSVVNSFGTPNFREHWNNAVYDHYAKEGQHSGILIIGATTYKYIVNGAQLLNTHQTSPGSIYYPASKQTRELAPQISIG